jgi:hypothetical protein
LNDKEKVGLKTDPVCRMEVREASAGTWPPKPSLAQLDYPPEILIFYPIA